MKVFLSSTGRDLMAYREAAAKAIRGLYLQPVCMEDFHGPAVKVEDFDDQRIAECDLVVIIIGHLHGTCPEGSEQSYTELEYEAAQRLKKPYCLFIAPEDFPFPANLIENDDRRAKQRAFRERAGKGVIQQTFNSPDDLKAQITQAIYVWRNSPAKPQSLLPLPPQYYFAHPYPLQEHFTGRLRERRMLTEWLTGSRNALSMVAIGGMGKSALTWAWMQTDVLGLSLPGVSEGDGGGCQVTDSDRPEGVLWWSFYEKESSFGAFVREALHRASDGQVDPRDYVLLFDQLKLLKTFLTLRRLLLVLDGFERELRAYAGLNAAYQGDDFAKDADGRSCINPHASAFLQWLASAQMRSHVLLTSRLHPRELDDLAGCQHYDLTAIEPEDAVHFFHAQGVRGSRAEIQAACAPYGYHPLALRLLAGVIVKDHRNPGDIRVAARHPVSAEMVGKEKHHILQVAYDAMDKPRRELLSRLAAFQSPMNHEALMALNPFRSEAKFDSALDELIDRGLLFFDRVQARYDLHPVVRQHAYDRLADKAGVHIYLRDYFIKVTALGEEKIENLDELAPVIELYHHILRAGQFDEALKLYQERLGSPLYFRLGAYQVCIELLRGLFPDGEDRPPRLKSDRDQSWAQNDLALSYDDYGQSRRALPLLLRSIDLDERRGDQKNVAVNLGNLATIQLSLGQFREADKSFRQRIALSRGIQDEFENIGHRELGRLEAYQGRYKESSDELDAAFISFRTRELKQSEGVVWAHRALRAFLMKNPREAIEAARQSRELADVDRSERDIIRANWLLGLALILQSLSEAEVHLSDALTRCRRINLVEFEPAILLAWARWHRASRNATEAREHAVEALTIADRCEYRLVQADVHNFLAQLALDADDRPAALHHAEIARERAWCDGPPHCYKPALDEADALLLRCKKAVKKV